MKLLLFAAVVLLSINGYGQNKKIVGEYSNYSNCICSLLLNADSTFYYDNSFSILGVYASGTWSAVNDTIYFKPIPKENRVKSVDGWSRITLSLSSDRKSIATLEEPIPFPMESESFVPLKLYFKKNRLYEIDVKGKIIKSKDTVWNKKKKGND